MKKSSNRLIPRDQSVPNVPGRLIRLLRVGVASTCILTHAYLITSTRWASVPNARIQSVYGKLSSMSTPETNPDSTPAAEEIRDIAEVAAIEIITTAAVHLMSAAAVKCGLAEGHDAEELTDLDEARKLITALAGLVTSAAPEIGSQHAGPLRDGLRSLQLAFREASAFPDAPGQGPGEKLTGPVN